MRDAELWDLLFELKYIGLADLGMTGEAVRAADAAALSELPKVRQALDEAEEQARRYGAELEQRFGNALRLQSFGIVALGFERLVVRRLGPEPESAETEA